MIMVSYLQVENLTKSFGDLLLFQGISFGVAQGQRIGLTDSEKREREDYLIKYIGREGRL